MAVCTLPAMITLNDDDRWIVRIIDDFLSDLGNRLADERHLIGIAVLAIFIINSARHVSGEVARILQQGPIRAENKWHMRNQNVSEGEGRICIEGDLRKGIQDVVLGLDMQAVKYPGLAVIFG